MSKIEATSSQLAEILGVSVRRVQQLVAEGVAVRGSARGKYDVALTVQAFVKAIKEEYSAPEARLKAAQATKDLAKLERQEVIDKGELVPVDRLEALIHAFDRGLTKAGQALGRRIIASPLWRAGTNAEIVQGIAVDVENDLRAWIGRAMEMSLAGATIADLDLDLFSVHSTPPTAPVTFGTPARTRRHKASEGETA